MGILIKTFSRAVGSLQTQKNKVISRLKTKATDAIDYMNSPQVIPQRPTNAESAAIQQCYVIAEKPLTPTGFTFFTENIRNVGFDDIAASLDEIVKFKDKYGNLLFTKELGHQRTFHTQALLEAKYNNPEHYEDFLTLLELSNKGKIKYIPRFIMPEGKVNPLVKKDIEAVVKKQNYFEEFDSTVNSFEILSKISEGDAFSIGQKMYVRTNKGFDKLSIDKETYKLLFPPVDRYAIAQGHSQNCGPIALINNLIQVPANRVKFYKLFEQKGDKIIVHTLGNIFNRSTFDLNELYRLSDGVLSQTCYGIKMLEKHSNKNFDISVYGLVKPVYGDKYFCKDLIAEKGTVFMPLSDVNIALLNRSQEDIERLKNQIRTVGHTTTMISGGGGSPRFGTGHQHYISVFDCTNDLVKYSNPCGTAEYREMPLEDFIRRVYDNVFYHNI